MRYIPQIITMIILSLQCIAYVPNLNIVITQIIAYLILTVFYLVAPKYNILRDTEIRRCYVLLVVVVALIGVRVFWDLELIGMQQALYNNNSTVYFFYIFSLILPILCIPKLKGVKNLQSPLFYFSLLLLICLSSSFFSILNGRGILTQDGRFDANESISTIQYGHLGLIAVILGGSFLLNKSLKFFFKPYSLLLITIGIISIFLAGTRSVFVAFMSCLMLYLLARGNIRSSIFFCVLVGGIFLCQDWIIEQFSYLDSNSAARVFRLFTEGGDQSSGRSVLYTSAMSDIFDNPFLGKSYFFELDNQSYVHNSIIETTRAIGCIGGVLFLILNIYALKFCYQIIKYKKEYCFFAFLFIQFFIYSLLSDSLIRIQLYWFSLAMLLYIKNNYQLINYEVH